MPIRHAVCPMVTTALAADLPLQSDSRITGTLLIQVPVSPMSAHDP